MRVCVSEKESEARAGIGAVEEGGNSILEDGQGRPLEEVTFELRPE